MKKLKLIAMLLLIGAVAISCKNEAGPAGPAGANGTNGTNGNANVKVYGYGSTTLNATNAYYAHFNPTGLTAGKIDSSLIVSYYMAGSGQWNMANGLGPSGMYSTIQYTDPIPPATINIYLRNGDGTGYSGADITWDSVRIFVIPASILKSTPAGKLDYRDYHEVSSYFSQK